LAVHTPLTRKDFHLCNGQQSNAEASLVIDSIMWQLNGGAITRTRSTRRKSMKSNIQVKSEDLPPAAEPREWFVMLFGGSSIFVLWQIDAAILCFPENPGLPSSLEIFS
jgi:hypothetical protein